MSSMESILPPDQNRSWGSKGGKGLVGRRRFVFFKQSSDVDVHHSDLLQMISAQVRACVLYMDPSTRVVGLSLRRYLVQPLAAVEPCPVDRIGEVVEKCKITAIHHMSGALLELPGQTVTFVHVSLHGMYDQPALSEEETQGTSCVLFAVEPPEGAQSLPE